MTKTYSVSIHQVVPCSGGWCINRKVQN